MAALKIAYGYPIAQTYIDRLNSLPGVELFDIVGLLQSEKDAASEHGPDSPEATAARQQVDDVISQIEIYYSASLPGGLPKRAPNLKWLQYVWDGIDLDVGPDILESPYRHHQRPPAVQPQHRRVGGDVHADVQQEASPAHRRAP